MDVIISVAIIFGAETVIAGIFGIGIGSFLGQTFRRLYPKADPMVCAIGLLFSAPFMCGTLIMADGPAVTTFILMFFGQLFLNLNWSLVADITMVKRVLGHVYVIHSAIFVSPCFTCYVNISMCCFVCCFTV